MTTDAERLDFLERQGATVGPMRTHDHAPASWWHCYIPGYGSTCGDSPRTAIDRTMEYLAKEARNA